MSAELLIDWIEIYPLTASEWEVALQEVIEVLRIHYPVRYKSHNDRKADVFIITYMAGDHERILRSRALEALLAERPDMADATVLLIACARRKPALTLASVRELLIDQGPEAGRSRPLRANSPEELARGGRDSLTASLNQRQLTESAPLVPADISTVLPQRVARRKRVENI